MCQHCDYAGLLEGSGLGYTPNRHRVLEVVGNNSGPLSAQQIFDTLSRNANINRVTVYRILGAQPESSGPSPFLLQKLRQPGMPESPGPGCKPASHAAHLSGCDRKRRGSCRRGVQKLFEDRRQKTESRGRMTESPPSPVRLSASLKLRQDKSEVF